MLRKDLKPGDIFKFTEAYDGNEIKIVDRDDPRFVRSLTASSGRLTDKVILLGRGGELFVSEAPNAAEALQPHWRALSPEPVSVIEAWGHHKNWYRGNAIKYLARAGSKKGVPARDDLLKALSFIIREITSLDGAPSWILGNKEQDANKQ